MFVINFKKTWYNNDKVTDENNEIGEKIMKLKEMNFSFHLIICANLFVNYLKTMIAPLLVIRKNISMYLLMNFKIQTNYNGIL